MELGERLTVVSGTVGEGFADDSEDGTESGLIEVTFGCVLDIVERRIRRLPLRLVSDDVLEFGRGILRFNIGVGLLFALEFCEGF